MPLIDLLTHAGWNVLLAIIPIVLAYLIAGLVRRPKKQGRSFVTVLIALLVFAWLSFLPNTCYLLSEWRHFLPTDNFYNLAMSWREARDKEAILSIFAHTLFYFCYSAFGMLAFALAIRPVARLARTMGLNRWLLALPMFLLVSAGVFLGLMRRLNSWDVVTGPARVWHAINADRTQPLGYRVHRRLRHLPLAGFPGHQYLDRRVYPALEANSEIVDSG